MSAARTAAVALGATRILYDVSLLALPKRVGTPWIGSLAERKAARLTLRSVAARDLAVNAGIVISAMADAPVRPWLAAAVVGDVADVAATFVARDDVPDGVPAKLVAVGGGSAALSAVVFAWADR
jgi:hypothetical protein